MANGLRGEIAFALRGENHALVLTLGALAALEQDLDSGGLGGLADRLAAGRLSAADTLAVLAAGFVGAGKAMRAEDLGRLIPASEFAQARNTAAALLAASFGGGSPSRPPPPQAAD